MIFFCVCIIINIVKKNIIFIILVINILFLLFIGCPLQEEEITVFSPVYMSLDKLRNSISTTSDIPEFSSLGKIILYNDYIFINKINKGVFIINNTDKSNPQIVKFITIPGNLDLAIKDNFLYCDSYIDLVVFDINNINNISVVKRLTDVFPRNDMQPFVGSNINFFDQNFKYEFEDTDKTKGIVVDWKERKEKRTIDPLKYGDYLYWSGGDGGNLAEIEGGGTSIGGSMARFTLYNEYLYCVNDINLYVFKVNQPSDPTYDKKVVVAFGIETIFSYERYLFIGGQNGVYIYDVSNDPSTPKKISQLLHITSWDPVVVKGRYAYSTLRGNLNELYIIDINDISDPRLITSYRMKNPHGLGIVEISSKDYLFICDGNAGVKIYDASNPSSLSLKKTILASEDTYDVILYNNTAYIVTKGSFYQYDYSNINNITYISKISIK